MEALQAFVDGDYALFQFLSSPATINETDDDGFAAIHYATSRLHLGMMRFCLELGASLEGRYLADAPFSLLIDKLTRGTFLCKPNTWDELFHPAQLLIDYGGHATYGSKDLPIFASTIIKQRERCRRTALLILGLRRKRFIALNQDVNILRIISKQIWSHRFWRMTQDLDRVIDLDTRERLYPLIIPRSEKVELDDASELIPYMWTDVWLAKTLGYKNKGFDFFCGIYTFNNAQFGGLCVWWNRVLEWGSDENIINMSDAECIKYSESFSNLKRRVVRAIERDWNATYSNLPGVWDETQCQFVISWNE